MTLTAAPRGAAAAAQDRPLPQRATAAELPPLSLEAAMEEAREAGVPESDVDGVATLAVAVGARGLEPLADPLTLLRFYRARGRNSEAAAAMFRETMRWRANFSIYDVMKSYGTAGEYHEDGRRTGDASEWTWQWQPSTTAAKLAMRHAFFGRLSKPMEDGAPVLVWRAGTADYSGFVREGIVEELLRAWVAHIEDALQAARAASLQQGRLIRARLIIDSKGFGFENVRHLPILRRIIGISRQVFPELSASVTVLRAPRVAVMLYGIVSNWLPKLLRDKVCILGEDFDEGLFEHTGVDRGQLPNFLGGTTSDDQLPPAESVPAGAGAGI